ncbi:hypothetical protein ACFC26_41270 [Kitasatospora purpeofusca]|uniref:hypothetical protein n=1 Tax=Kitasatospora purpeofusca TaxID=67352 RepID=UPI0035DCC9A0
MSRRLKVVPFSGEQLALFALDQSAGAVVEAAAPARRESGGGEERENRFRPAPALPALHHDHELETTR